MNAGPWFLSTLAGASFFLFGLWFLSKQDARLEDFGLVGHAPGVPKKTAIPEPVLVTAAALAWIVSRKHLSGPWSAAAALAAAWTLCRWVRGRYLRARRDEELRSEWPLLLESMSVAALSGLDLNAAFIAASKRTAGALRKEADRVVLRMTGGLPLSRALDTLVRDRVPGAERLASMLLQCELLGTPIAEVLDSLALEATNLERQDMEARFNSLPLKLSVVTVVFLLPPILIVSIAPHVLVFLNSQW